MNFGHKILIVFIAFGALMGTLVYMSMQTEFELVSKDYYKEELAYQDVIDASRNASSLVSSLQLSQTGGQVELRLPAEMSGRQVNGEVYFYCPSDSKKDRRIPLKADAGGLQVFEVGQSLLPAGYKVKVNWIADGKNYYQESFLRIQ